MLTEEQRQTILATLCVAFLVFVAFAGAYSGGGSHPVQPTEGIDAEQDEIRTQREGDPRNKLTPPSEAQTVSAARGRQGGDNSGVINVENTEFWQILGVKLKITDTVIAIFTVILAVSTLLLWISTRKLVIGAELTAERQLRAYVLVENALTTQFGPVSKIQIAFKNSGQTPAYRLSVWASIEVAVDPLEQRPDPPSGESEQKGTFGAGATLHLLEETTRIIVTEELNGVRSGEAGLYIFGQLSYTDIFQKIRTTTFCFIYGGAGGVHPDGNMRPYKDWNEAT